MKNDLSFLNVYCNDSIKNEFVPLDFDTGFRLVENYVNSLWPFLKNLNADVVLLIGDRGYRNRDKVQVKSKIFCYFLGCQELGLNS